MPNIVFNICKYRKITCPNRLDVPVRKICVFALCIEYIRKETWYIFSSVNLNFDRFQLTKSGCTILICMCNHRRTAANISYLLLLKDGLHIVLSNVCMIKLAATTRFGTFFKDLIQTVHSFWSYRLLCITHMLKDFLSFLINTRYFWCWGGL